MIFEVGDLVYRKDHDEDKPRPLFIILEIDKSLCMAGDIYTDEGWRQYLIRRVPFRKGDSIIPFFFNGLEAA